MTKRPLGPLSLFALGVNGTVGVGIFFAPADVAASVPGPAGSLVYLVTALLLAPIAWAYSSLGARFPVDGGPYVWAKAAFGETFAFYVGWMTYVSAVFSMGAVMAAFGRHAGPTIGLEGTVAQRLFALGTLVTLSLIAGTGLRPSAHTWSVLTVVKLIPLALLLGLGAMFRSSAGAALPPSVPHDLERAVLVVVFAMQGFEIVPVVAGSAARAERFVPFGTLGALAFVAVLYAAIHAVVAAASPVAGSDAPLVDAARALGGVKLGTVVAYGANVSALGIGFGMCVLTPRYLSVLGDRRALGLGLDETTARGVPVRAMVVTVLVASALVVIGERGELFALSSVAVLAQYGVTVAALAVLAYRQESGFTRRHLLPVPLALVGIVLASLGAEWKEILAAVGVLALGAAVLVARRSRAR